MGRGEHDDEPVDDGPDDDHTPRGAPPDPLDRVWVHPTELPDLPAGVAPPGREPRRSVVRRSRRLVAPVLAGAAGALVTLAVLAVSGSFDDATETGNRTPATLSTASGAADAEQVALRIGLSVVAIAARDSRGSRFGSGVCVRHAGGVLTTARLVGSAETVDVIASDGRRYGARVVGRDTRSDLVLLALDSGADIPAVALADEPPNVGAGVWVMGAAGAGTSAPWVSAGLVSSTDAVVATAEGSTATGLLETDAASNDDAVGGALVDRDGNVAGIVLGNLANGATTFALPIDTALEIADALGTDGVAPHASAGMTVVDGPNGPTVMSMLPEGPAARAGVRVGDIVSAVDGLAVESTKDVMSLVRAEVGRTVIFQLVRGAVEHKVRVDLAASGGDADSRATMEP